MTDEEIRAKALDIINARRDSAITQMKNTIDEVYSACPKLVEVEQGLIANMKALCVLAIDGDAGSIDELKKQVENLRETRKDLLFNVGLTDNIFVPRYSCTVCEDTGFYKNKRCECFKKLCEELATSELPQKLGTTPADFESFSLDYYTYDKNVYTQMSKVLSAAIQYSKSDVQDGKNLMLIGGTGLGKTHIALSIARKSLKQNTISRARFTSAFAMCEAVECERYERRNPTKEQIRLAKDIFSVPLLIIDSLETLRDRDEDRAVLFNLIDTRLTAGLATIITTSMNATEMHRKCGDMTCTKLESAYKIFNFIGNDIRLIINTKNN